MYKKMWFKQKKGEWQAFTGIYFNVINQIQLPRLKNREKAEHFLAKSWVNIFRHNNSTLQVF